MKNHFSRILIFLLFLFHFYSQAFAQTNDEKIPNPLAQIRSEIVEDKDFANAPLLAITMANPKGWHTYWKNPGDAGLPLKFSFFKGEDNSIAPLTNSLIEKEWPAPSRMIEQGDMLAYGFNNSNTFFFDLNANTLNELEGKNFTTKITFLICSNICIPGEISVSGLVSSGKYLARNSEIEIDRSELLKRFKAMPKIQERSNELDFILAKAGENKLVLYYNFHPKEGGGVDTENLITPFPLTPFTFKREELFRDKDGHLYGKIPIDFDGEYQEPPLPFPADGKFNKTFNFQFLLKDSDNSTLVLQKNFEAFELEKGAKLEAFYKDLIAITPTRVDDAKENTKDNSINSTPEIPSKTSLSFFLAICLAFIGGLILNIMPCVLPVISLKLFSLVKLHSENSKALFRHNFFYTLGILITFLAMSVVIIVLKNLGTEVGWGFQLQSPLFVLIIITILTVMALNFFGLYELSTPGSSLLNLKIKDGPISDIFSGFLATILSTPCSAPFLGSALTYAFTENAMTTIAVFLSIGIGLSSPFILTAFFPKIIGLIPRPGEWMNHVKKYLGLTLLLTVIWLIDVFVALTTDWGNLPLLQLLAFLTLITFTLVMNKYQKNLVPKIIHLAAVTLIGIWIVFTLFGEVDSSQGGGLIAEKNRSELKWERWNEEKMKELQSQGQVTFIDFTAKWCFTCKANEKLVIETQGFRDLTLKYNVKLLLADWTKRDELIGNWLLSQGLAGVPAYFVINQKKEIINLGETLSLSKIEHALSGEKSEK